MREAPQASLPRREPGPWSRVGGDFLHPQEGEVMAATFQPEQFSCAVDGSSSDPVIAPSGELDLVSVETLQPLVDETLLGAPQMLVVDLRGLTFVDSTGLRCLLELADRSRAEGFELELVPGGPSVMRLFDLTGTREVLPFRASA